MNLKMAELREQIQIRLLQLLGMKQVGTLIMILVVVMVISMPQKVLTQVLGLVQQLAAAVIPVMMNLPAIRALRVPVNIQIPVMIVMVTV